MKTKQRIRRSPKEIVFISIICILAVYVIFDLCVNNHVNKWTTSFNNPYHIVVSKQDNFVFLGDSITDFYPLEELYDELPVINSGVNGYTTDDILKNLNELVYRYNPTKVFLLIGTNDIRFGKNSDEIMKSIEKIVSEIKEHRPKAKMYIESIYPVNKSDDEKIDEDMVSIRDNQKIAEINEKIKAYCEKENITYIDLYKTLQDQEGNLALKYTTEGLHLSNLGYLKVTEQLLPYLQSEE